MIRDHETLLQEYRQWWQWIQDELPSSLLDALVTDQMEQLVDLLRHYHDCGGRSAAVNGEGAIMVVEGLDVLQDELERLVETGIRRTVIHRFEGKTPQGKQSFLVVHLDFATKTDSLPTGIADERLEEEVVASVVGQYPKLSKGEVRRALLSMDQAFLNEAENQAIARNIALFLQCESDHNVKAEVQEREGDRVSIALANRRASPTGFFLNLLKVIRFYNFELEGIRSLYAPSDSLDGQLQTLFHLRLPKGSAKKRETLVNRLVDALAVAQWHEFDNPLNQDFVEDLGFSLHHCLLLRSMEEFVHQMLVNVDEYLYSIDLVHEAFRKNPEISRGLVKCFSSRFNPVHRLSEPRYAKLEDALRSRIEELDSGIPGNDRRRRTILHLALDFVGHVQKSNYYVLRRSALSFRVDASIMSQVAFPEGLFPEQPFAIYYIKGRNFMAFNIRFRELSRGGVRTLLPLDAEKRDRQHKEVFRECYHLAYTQQAKNKDIPEGGSKSVIFVKNYRGFERDLAFEEQVLKKTLACKDLLEKSLEDHRMTRLCRQLFDAQKSFCDTLLDILVWDKKRGGLEYDVIRDDYGKEELVFLGPDENMLNPMIEWISRRSLERGYRVGLTFMSGKKEMGINHKAYGVTSLGVHEYLKAALKARGLGQNPFTVKVAGGPDGDVAGNQLMNLVKGFKAKAKILCIQDGTGVLFDPEGIDHGELKRLFQEGLGVSSVDTTKMKSGAYLLRIHERRQKSAGVSEILCLRAKGSKVVKDWLGASAANRIYSRAMLGLSTDVFLPCGGRPRTLNGQNVGIFLDDQGQPSSEIIVEGANLFLDEAARLDLESRGVLIVKDASANKCGVICSSYEIMAGLVTDEQEFSKAKTRLVKEVLQILRKKAGLEASILVQSDGDESVVECSDKVSQAINRWTDRIASELPLLKKKGKYPLLLKKVMESSVPDVLIESYGRRFKALPELYLDSLIAATIGSSLVYRHGIDFEPSLAASLVDEIAQGLLD